MIAVSQKPTKKQFIRPKGYENLYVVPYIRGRLVFAELAARTIEEDKFDQVVVDLPFFMNNEKLWGDAVDMFPYVSSLIMRKGESDLVSFPFVPNDAACISLASVKLLREWGRDIELRCIDDSRIAFYPGESLALPEVKVRDDYFVFTGGLEEYFCDAYRHLEASWDRMSEDQRMISEYRAGILKDRLINSLKNGKKTLFVCEYRLWRLISNIIKNGRGANRNYLHIPWENMEAALMLEDPYAFWSMGILDDYPFAVELFYRGLEKGSFREFDKLNSIRGLLRAAFKRSTQKEAFPLSIRKRLSFYQYLQNMMASDLCIVPQPLRHLYEAAYSCLGKKPAHEIARRFLRYPFPKLRKFQGYYIIHEDAILKTQQEVLIPEDSERIFFYTGSDRYTFDSVHSRLGPEDRIRIVFRLDPCADERLAASLGKTDASSWSMQADFNVYELACRKAREFARRRERRDKVKISWGAMGNGIHWKSTIASKAAGEDAIYIRKKSASNKTFGNRMDEYTPVTFIFEDDLNGHTERTMFHPNVPKGMADLGLDDKSAQEPPDYVFTIYYTYTKEDKFFHGHVMKRHVSFLTALVTNSLMGPAKYSLITKRPERFQCRTEPWADEEVKHFQRQEKGIAWAVRYAQDSVLVVAQTGWKPSQELAAFACSKGVRIITVPLSMFHPDFIQRLRTMYFASTQLKRRPDNDSIVQRFMDF